MKNYFKEICSLFPIRRSKEQKQKFFEYVSNEFEQDVVKKDLLDNKHENIVIGDIESASVIITAHYDTPATSLAPNFMMPANKLLTYAYHIGYPLVLALLSLALAFGIGNFANLDILYILVIYLIIFYAAFFGATRLITNKNNVNDNTSGVATLLSIAKQTNSKKIAFVLFDNEEKGLLGSKAMNKKYKELLKNKLVVNFDCVANGKEILFIVKNSAENCLEYELLRKSFASKDGFNVHFLPFKKCASNSDYKSFECGVGVSAYSKGKIFKFITGKIHTNNDTVGDEANIEYLTNATLEFINALN